MKTKTFTANDVINAIEKNGLKQAFVAFFKNAKGRRVTSGRANIVEACALGQAAINLGISYEGWETPNYADYHALIAIRARTITLNDNKRLPLSEIAKILREEYKYALEVEFTAPVVKYSKVVRLDDV